MLKKSPGEKNHWKWVNKFLHIIRRNLFTFCQFSSQFYKDFAWSHKANNWLPRVFNVDSRAEHCLGIVNWYWLLIHPFVRQAVRWGPFIITDLSDKSMILAPCSSRGALVNKNQSLSQGLFEIRALGPESHDLTSCQRSCWISLEDLPKQRSTFANTSVPSKCAIWSRQHTSIIGIAKYIKWKHN